VIFEISAKESRNSRFNTCSFGATVLVDSACVDQVPRSLAHHGRGLGG
jgi:hypothetical protein